MSTFIFRRTLSAASLPAWHLPVYGMSNFTAVTHTHRLKLFLLYVGQITQDATKVRVPREPIYHSQETLKDTIY